MWSLCRKLGSSARPHAADLDFRWYHRSNEAICGQETATPHSFVQSFWNVHRPGRRLRVIASLQGGNKEENVTLSRMAKCRRRRDSAKLQLDATRKKLAPKLSHVLYSLLRTVETSNIALAPGPWRPCPRDCSASAFSAAFSYRWHVHFKEGESSRGLSEMWKAESDQC